MAKATTHYVCQACGATSPKWSGKCDACAGWNTLVEEVRSTAAGGSPRHKHKASIQLEPLAAAGTKPVPRRQSGIGEFDRVTGGGLVPGSILLVAGDPGIGKSTLLLQVMAKLAPQLPCAYISGEEAMDQVRLRALRLNLLQAPLQLAAETDLAAITGLLAAKDAPRVVVLDSIQTLSWDMLDSAPGTVAQVRGCAQEIIRIAKPRGITVLLVGHVTKEGAIAGPRVLEHMVDTVLHFEGNRGHHFRILRALKNRFGATDEMGVFEMSDGGLMEVSNPSALFLAERQQDVAGAAVFAGIEGTRPVLVEIQALVAPTTLGTPRRAVVGWDHARLAMVLAVLEARCGLQFGLNDVYLNVAGGLRISEPAADLAVAAALISALQNEPVPAEAVLFGEIGLSGEVRAVAQPELRLKEAAKLGFRQALLPAPVANQRLPTQGIQVQHIRQLGDLLPLFGLATRREKRPRTAG